jgi:hypothetical protein
VDESNARPGPTQGCVFFFHVKKETINTARGVGGKYSRLGCENGYSMTVSMLSIARVLFATSRGFLAFQVFASTSNWLLHSTLLEPKPLECTGSLPKTTRPPCRHSQSSGQPGNA